MKLKAQHNESGQVLVITALCLTCVLGFVALSVDVGLLLRAKRIVQTAADSAAIAGAAELIAGDWSAAAKADSAQNGVTDGTGGATVTVNNGPSTGPHAGNTAYVEVIVSQPQNTFFMNLFNISSMTVTARAVATNVPGTGCIYTMNPTGTDISLTGSGSLTLPTCGILDNSSNSTSALTLTGSGSITAKSIGIVGGYTKTGSGTITPNPPSTHIASFSDPLSSLSPPTFTAGSCVADPKITGSKATTIGPTSGGTICYNGLTIVGSAAVTFRPGLYIINGDFSATGSGNLTGTGGVTFYLPSNGDNLSITGSGDLDFTAPTSGAYSGILFYQNPADKTAATFTGAGSSTLNGIFYLPTATINMTGSGGASFNTDLVVGALNITGSLPLNEYVPLSGTSPLSNPRLVE